MLKLEEALCGAGLSEKEAKIYLASLELGGGTALQIARKAGINRGTTYLIAENLMQRGLMGGVVREGCKYFCAEPPERIVSKMEKEHETIAERRSALAGVLPELEALIKSSPARPAVRYYESMAGLETMREILYRSRHDEILSAVDLDEMAKRLSMGNMRLHQKKMKLYDVSGRILYTCGEEKNELILTGSSSSGTHEHRRLEKDAYCFPAETVILGDAVAMVSYAEGIVGTIIEHKNFAASMRSLFNLAWDAAGMILKK